MTAISNLVEQTSTTTGTGNLVLAAVNGRQSFNSAFGTGGTDAFYYFVINEGAAEWEVGTGHMSDSSTLVRDTVIESTNSGAAVNFSAGTKRVTNALPANLLLQSGGPIGTPSSGALTNCTGLPAGGLSATATSVLFGRVTAGAGAGEELDAQDVRGILNVATFNPFDYGATGDGSTDDTTAFENMITAINASSYDGAIIQIPPETYSIPAGISVTIKKSNCYIFAYGATFVHGSNPLWTFGDQTTQYYRGGITGGHYIGSSATATCIVCKVQGYQYVKLKDISVDRVAGLVVLGATATYAAPGCRIENVRGSLLDIDNGIGVDCVYGGGLFMNKVYLSAVESGGSAPTIPTDRSTTNAQAATKGIRVGSGGTWDTIVIDDSAFGHFQIGFYVVASGSISQVNWKIANTYFDYCGTHALQMNPAGGSLNFITFVNCWFCSIDSHAVSIEGTSGAYRNLRFIACEGRQAGQRNWSLTSTVMHGTELIGCRGMGANRLSSNTGSLQDDLYIAGDSVKVIGGRFGEDGSPYTGISGHQGRYGITTGANLANLVIEGVTSDGATDGYQISAYTTAKNGVAIRNNLDYSGTRPNYAGQSTLTTPTSGATQTYFGPYDRVMYITGGTVTSVVHNGVTVSGTTNATFQLKPGDTWSVTYSSSPTCSFVNYP